MKEFLNLKEVAELFGVSERTIQREIETGKLEAFKVGRAYRFKREAIQRYINSQTVNTEEEDKTAQPC